MLLLLLPVLANAKAAPEMEDCGGLFVAGTLPAIGQEEVPTDARLAVKLGDGCGFSASSDLTVELVDPVDEQSWFSESVTWDRRFPDRIYEVFPGSLDANDEHLLRVLVNNGEFIEATFTTGAGSATQLTATPELVLYSAEADPSQDGWWISARVDVSGAPDPDGLSVVHLFNAEDPDTIVASGVLSAGGTLGLQARWDALERPKELCLQALRSDGAGRTSSLSDPACVEVARTSGCSAAGGLPAAGLVWLGLVVVAGRRRG